MCYNNCSIQIESAVGGSGSLIKTSGRVTKQPTDTALNMTWTATAVYLQWEETKLYRSGAEDRTLSLFSEKAKRRTA